MATYRDALGWKPKFYDTLNFLMGLEEDVRCMIPMNEITGTTLTDYSMHGLNFTAAVNTSTTYGSGGRALKYQSLNGTTVYASRADAAEFSFDGAGDHPFSMLAMFRDTASAPGATGVVVSKWDGTAASEDREWMFDISGGQPRFFCYDETNNDGFSSIMNAVPTLNTWHLLGWTYSASTSAVADLTPYVDGAAVAHTDTPDGGAYANMVGGATGCYIGASVDTAAATNLLEGDLAWVALIGEEISAEQMNNIWLKMKYIAGR